MELSSLQGSLLSSLPHRQSTAISRHSVSFTSSQGLRYSCNLWRRSLDLDRFGLVLSRVVKSKEDLEEDLELDEGEEGSNFWNPLDLLQDLSIKEKELLLTNLGLSSEKLGKSDLFGLLMQMAQQKKFSPQLDSEITYKALVYGSGVLAALLVTSAITSAVDSIPLVPKLMEVVGLGFTVWFSFRYLIFKENRDELFAKVDDLKKQIFGYGDD